MVYQNYSEFEVADLPKDTLVVANGAELCNAVIKIGLGAELNGLIVQVDLISLEMHLGVSESVCTFCIHCRLHFHIH